MAKGPELQLKGEGLGASATGPQLGMATAGKHTLVEQSLRIPEPAELGLGPVQAPLPRLQLGGPLFELENQVRPDFKKLKRARFDVASEDEYVARVEVTFGSLRAYLDWAPKSDELLERPISSKKRIRDLVELQGEEQRVFFRWVSWEYQKRGFGLDAIAALITKGVDPQMASALSGAAQEYGRPIAPQGFNPRPMKGASLRYRLGTLSEHATGRAIDIAPDRNPIISAKAWRAIQQATGVSVDLHLAKWQFQPEAYYDALAALDEAWVRKVDTGLRAPQWAREHAGALLPDKLRPPQSIGGVAPAGRLELRRPELLEEESSPTRVIGELLGGKGSKELTAEASKLAALPGFHFLSHDRELVLALRRQGMVWGATFFPGSVDLHHFELREQPLPPAPGEQAEEREDEHSK